MADRDDDWDRVRTAEAQALRAMGVPEELLERLGPTGRLLPGGDAGPAQLGGRPRLDGPWPDRDGRPLHHLLQVDLAAVPATLHQHGLPREGLLTVFHDVTWLEDGQGGWGEWPDDRGATRVLLVPAQAPVAEWPEALPQDGRHHALPAQVELHPDLGPIMDALVNREAGDPPPGGHDAWDAFADEVWERSAHGGGPGPRHRLLGLPDPVQGPPLEECPGHLEGWRLLVQLDSDDGLWTWGDAGTLYVCVPREDLPAGDLSRCWTIMQCF